EVNAEEYRIALENMRCIPEIDDLESKIETYNKYAFVVYNARTAIFSLGKAEKEGPWGQHIQEIFRNEGVYAKTTVDHDAYSSQIRSTATVELHDMRKKWYANDGTKIVPPFILTPNVALHWYIGDGSASYNILRLATQCFTKTEVEGLVEQIQETVGVKASVEQDNRKGIPEIEYYIIKISRKDDVNRFMEYLTKAKSYHIAKELLPHKFETKWSIDDPNTLLHGYLNVVDIAKEQGITTIAAIYRNKDKLIEQTEELLNLGFLPAKIAKTFGVNRNTVYGWIKKYNLKL
ncbi:MAG: terminase gpP N-terminus-related DNA-binding protein, partial [Candidatus Kariarchaeaceae archaeon]